MDQGLRNQTIDPAPNRRQSRPESSQVGLGSDFLNKTPKAQEIKARINKWDGFKLRSFFSAKDTINDVKREPTESEKIFSTCTSDTALISKIYKELTKLYTKTTKNPINKWVKELDRHFTEEGTQAINKYMKKCSTSLVIREMQIKTILRLHLTPIRMAIIKNMDNNRCQNLF